MSLFQFLRPASAAVPPKRSRRVAAGKRHGQRKRPESHAGAAAIEQLENRYALAGNTVVFYVAGGGGATFPDKVIAHVDNLIDKGSVGSIEQFKTNWNSPDFDDPVNPSGHPGGLSTPGIPFTDDFFVNALSGKLELDYNDADTIVLIGHSFGGDSLLKVARRLQGKRQIDVLATLDPISFGGDRAKIDVSSNVQYFFNRWQEILPFPNEPEKTGSLPTKATHSTAKDFGVADQERQSIRKLANGGDDWHGPTALELTLLFGSPQFFRTTFPDMVKYPLGKTEARSLTHQYLPLDEYISKQLIRVLDGVIPQGPTIVGEVVPAGLSDEGTTFRIDASASYDPNVGESIKDFRWLASDPRVVLSQGSLDLSVAIGDNFELPNDALSVWLEAWDGPRGAAESMYSFKEFTITTRNVAPRNVVIGGPGRYVRGFNVPLTATFDDPGFLDTHTATWSVPGSQAAGGSLLDSPTTPSRVTTVNPLYEAEGTYTVGVTIHDDDGGSGRAVDAALQIDAVGLAANPDNPALQDLLIGGSTSFDTIALRPGAIADTYVVDMNGVGYGPFPVTGVIRIAAQGGNDRIEIGAGSLSQLRQRIVVDAGDGSDRVVLIDNGRLTAADYLVTPSTVSIMELAGGFGGLVYSSSTEFLDVLGTEGVNVFDVQPSLDTAFVMDGNGPLSGAVEASRGDYLKLDTKTTFPADFRGFGHDTSGRRLAIDSRGRGRWEFTKGTGQKSVSFESIERFNHVDIVAVAAEAGVTGSPVVQVLDGETLEPLFIIPATKTFGSKYRGGTRVATGDLDNDGLPDVAIAPGRTAAPVVKVFNGSPQAGVQGTEILNQRIAAQSTFGVTYAGGVNIAVGDVTGDTLNDVIVTRSWGPGTVRVFENKLVAGTPFAELGRTAARTFNAFPQLSMYQGGSSVAVGDVGRLGKQQIVVGSGAGMPGIVRVFDVRIPAARYAARMQIIDPTVPAIRGGLHVAVGDLDDDGHADIVTGSGAAGGSRVRVFNGKDGSHRGGVQTGTGLAATIPARVAVRSIDGDKRMMVFATWGADARRNYQVVRLDPVAFGFVDDFRVSGNSLSGGGIGIG